MHNFSSLLNITLHVSDGLFVQLQEFKAVYTKSSIPRAVKKFLEMWYSTVIVGHMTTLT